jgi:hypothetical protein
MGVMWQWQRGGCDSVDDQLRRIVDESKAVRIVSKFIINP